MACWAITYNVVKQDDGPNNMTGDDRIIDNTDLITFDGSRYCFRQPTRAIKSVYYWYRLDQDDREHLMERGYRISSGVYNAISHSYKRTGKLVLKAGAFAMAGKTDELVRLANSLPHEVQRIVIADGEKDVFQVGYARVARKTPIGGSKDKETVVIIAPQLSWWDKGYSGKKDTLPIHTKEGWHAFGGDRPKIAGKSLEGTTLASWLPEADREEPWISVDEKYFK